MKNIKYIPEAKVVEGEYSTIKSNGGKQPIRKMFSIITKGINQMLKTFSWHDFWWWLFGTTILAILAGVFLGLFQACERHDNHMQELRRIEVDKCKMTPKQSKRLYPDFGEQGDRPE